MSKLTLTNITSGYATNTAINTNNDLIEAAIENTLSRDGTSPNTMGADIDMNGYRILNELAQSGDGFIWKGAWITDTDYTLNNLVSNSGSSYICKVAHTASAVFATDLAAEKWQVIATKGDPGAGTGDMLISNNLSELTVTQTIARGNIGAAKSGANTDITSIVASVTGNVTGNATTATTATNVSGGTVSCTTLTASSITTLATSLTGKLRADAGVVSIGKVLGTEVASTSGTSIDFTSIPAWATKITVMFNGVSTNGTSQLMIQLGDSGGIETSGYVGTCIGDVHGGTTDIANSTTCFPITATEVATYQRTGAVVLNLMNSSTHSWTYTSILTVPTDKMATGAGVKTLSGILDRIRISTVAGTATFDAGLINLIYE